MNLIKSRSSPSPSLPSPRLKNIALTQTPYNPWKISPHRPKSRTVLALFKKKGFQSYLFSNNNYINSNITYLTCCGEGSIAPKFEKISIIDDKGETLIMDLDIDFPSEANIMVSK